MSKQLGALRLPMPVIVSLCLLCFFSVEAAAQEFPMSPPTMKNLRVEYSFVYMERAYTAPQPIVIPDAAPPNENLPERVLISYLSKLANGDVDGALGYWTKESKVLISKKNSSISRSELVDAVRATNNGIRVRFLNRIDYGPYVILEIEKTGTLASAKPELDSFALRKDDGRWQMTQELADDPVLCCRNSPNGRVIRPGVPGGEFKRMLEGLR